MANFLFKSMKRNLFYERQVSNTNISNFIAQLKLGQSNQEILEEEARNVLI